MTDIDKLGNNGVVIDKISLLMWESKVDNKVYSLSEIFEYIEQLNAKNYLGYSDWRIPSKDELETLIDNNILSPKDGMYWSSTFYDDYNVYVLSVYHNRISYYIKTYAYYLRCVRGNNN